jgi:hypothetical protein
MSDLDSLLHNDRIAMQREELQREAKNRRKTTRAKEARKRREIAAAKPRRSAFGGNAGQGSKWITKKRRAAIYNLRPDEDFADWDERMAKWLRGRAA